MLVSWYFEPSQPQRITSGAKNNVQAVSYLLSMQIIKPQIINNKKKTTHKICPETIWKMYPKLPEHGQVQISTGLKAPTN